MLQNCAKSCDEVAAADERTAKELANIHSFFDLSAKDINGNVIQFNKKYYNEDAKKASIIY